MLIWPGFQWVFNVDTSFFAFEPMSKLSITLYNMLTAAQGGC